MAKITVYGMEKYLNSLGKSLFSGVTFPTGIDRDVAINECIIQSNEFEVLYPDGDFFIEAVTQWSKKYALTFAKWVEGFAAEFSPIDNYDRNESWEDHKGSEDKTTYGKKNTTTYGKTDSTTYGKTDTTTFGKTTTETHEVSAYDSTAYQPKDKTITGTANTDSIASTGTDSIASTGTDSDQLSGSDTVTGKENSSHKGRIHGNIGVMRTTDILQGWINFYNDNTIYKLIADTFVAEFCIMVY